MLIFRNIESFMLPLNHAERAWCSDVNESITEKAKMETTTASRQSDLITRSEAAAFLRVSPGSLSNWASSSKYRIPYIKIGKKVYYRIKDLQQYIDRHAINKLEGE